MSYHGDELTGLCRRCSWLEAALLGHRHPLPAENGEAIDFSTYPAIGPVITLS